MLAPLVRGEQFPHAFPQRRLALGGLLRSGFGLFPGDTRSPHRHLVAMLDEDGAVGEFHDVGSAEAAAELAQELNGRGT